MACTFEPARLLADGRPVYEATCEVCGAVCNTWTNATADIPSREEIVASLTENGIARGDAVVCYCGDHKDQDPATVPIFITPAQLRIAARRVLGIDRATLEGTVAAIIAGIEDQAARADARDKWDLATVIERNHPLIDVVRQAFGKTEAEVDQMFRAGATL